MESIFCHACQTESTSSITNNSGTAVCPRCESEFIEQIDEDGRFAESLGGGHLVAGSDPSSDEAQMISEHLPMMFAQLFGPPIQAQRIPLSGSRHLPDRGRSAEAPFGISPDASDARDASNNNDGIADSLSEALGASESHNDRRSRSASADRQDSSRQSPARTAASNATAGNATSAASRFVDRASFQQTMLIRLIEDMNDVMAFQNSIMNIPPSAQPTASSISFQFGFGGGAPVTSFSSTGHLQSLLQMLGIPGNMGDYAHGLSMDDIITQLMEQHA
eukprot:jgi/Hompol1/3302/HPOL_003194-RA